MQKALDVAHSIRRWVHEELQNWTSWIQAQISWDQEKNSDKTQGIQDEDEGQADHYYYKNRA